MAAILIFKCIEGARVVDYSSLPPKPPPAPLVVLTLMQDGKLRQSA